jgi:hypothetical protein
MPVLGMEGVYTSIPSIRVLSSSDQRVELLVSFGYKPVFGFEVRQRRGTEWILVKQIALEDQNQPLIKFVLDGNPPYPELEFVAVFLRGPETGPRTSGGATFTHTGHEECVV